MTCRPGHALKHPEFVDLGLWWRTPLEAGLTTEAFTRKKALPWSMPGRLDEVETEWFRGRPLYRGQHSCIRVELNAFTAPELMTYVEHRLPEVGAGDKLTPPLLVAAEHAAKTHRDRMGQWVAERLAEWFDAEAVAETLVAETAPEMITEPSRWVADAYERGRGTSWRAAVSGSVQAGLAGIDEPLRSRLRELLGGDEQCAPVTPGRIWT